MALIATASAVIAALKAGSTINDPHPQLHLEERNAIAALQQSVSDNAATIASLQGQVAALSKQVPVLFTTEALAQAAGVAGQLSIGQFVEAG